MRSCGPAPPPRRSAGSGAWGGGSRSGGGAAAPRRRPVAPTARPVRSATSIPTKRGYPQNISSPPSPVSATVTCSRVRRAHDVRRDRRGVPEGLVVGFDQLVHQLHGVGLDGELGVLGAEAARRESGEGRLVVVGVVREAQGERAQRPLDALAHEPNHQRWSRCRRTGRRPGARPPPGGAPPRRPGGCATRRAASSSVGPGHATPPVQGPVPPVAWPRRPPHAAAVAGGSFSMSR